MQEQLPAGWDGVSEFPWPDVVTLLGVEVARVDNDELLRNEEELVDIDAVGFIIDDVVKYIER